MYFNQISGRDNPAKGKGEMIRFNSRKELPVEEMVRLYDALIVTCATYVRYARDASDVVNKEHWRSKAMEQFRLMKKFPLELHEHWFRSVVIEIGLQDKMNENA